MYADDGTATATGRTKEELEQKINEDMQQLHEYCETNHSTINEQKTKLQVFHSSKLPELSLHIEYNNSKIEQVNIFKLLGTYLDNNLNFNFHLDKVLNDMLFRINLISRHKYIFEHKRLLVFTNSLVLSILDYNLPIWGYICNSKIDRLDRQIIRMMEKCILGRTIPEEEKWHFFEKLNILSTTERRDLYSLKLIYNQVFSGKKNLSSINQIFKKRDDHGRSSKFSNCLHKPRYKKTFSQNSFHYNVINLWNKLPPTIQNSPSLSQFDIQLRQHLIKQRKDFYVYSK
jgi:hypothetical protein